MKRLAVLALAIAPASAHAQAQPPRAVEPDLPPEPWFTEPRSQVPVLQSNLPREDQALIREQWYPEDPPPPRPARPVGLEPQRPWVRRPRAWFARLEAGPVYQRIYDLSGFGACFLVAADHELPRADVTLGLSFSYGALSGLTAVRTGLYAGGDARFGAFRVGGGLGFGLSAISAATHVDSTAIAATVDLSARVTIDVVPFDAERHRAAYVGARFLASVILASDAQPVEWGPAIVVGVRL